MDTIKNERNNFQILADIETFDSIQLNVKLKQRKSLNEK